MRAHRVAASTALLISVSSFTALPMSAAYADTATTLNVNNATAANCSDTAVGAGSTTTPFCTVQAAVNAVSAGQTILVAEGVYAPFSVSTSGTAAAPITIKGAGGQGWSTSGVPTIGGSTTSAQVTVSGANFVNLVGLRVPSTTTSAVVITGSSHITFDSGYMLTAPTVATVPFVHVTSGSSFVTVSRNRFSGNHAGPAVAADGGGSNIQITTNLVGENDRGPGIVADGVPGVVITGNTVLRQCGLLLGVTGGSTSATIENNIANQVYASNFVPGCTAVPSAVYAILVDSSSAPGTTADYNAVQVQSSLGPADYSWAGVSYVTTAALTAATGQGAHDVGVPALFNGLIRSSDSALIDSANGSAPGELATDQAGNARVDDLALADTGAGTPTYHDRGALEFEGSTPLAQLNPNSFKAPVGGTVTFYGRLAGRWGPALTCTFDFGDGTPTVTTPYDVTSAQCTATHVYAAIGSYTPNLSGATSYNTIAPTPMSAPMQIVAAQPLAATLSAVPHDAFGVIATADATSAWTVMNVLINWGDGTGTIVIGPSLTHTYNLPGTYTITLTVNDAGGNSVVKTVSFTTFGQYYTPLTPARILDTRTGTGVSSAAKVAADGTVKLKVAGNGSIPATGVTAVALNVTVTNPTRAGVIVTYADGDVVPNASTVIFVPGQTVPNMVVVKVGADGYIDLENLSAGTTDLVADVAGYYSTTSANGFETLPSPSRVLDTRTTGPKLPPNGTTNVSFSVYQASAVVLNVTVTNPTKNGVITAYPDGTSAPNASNLNFAPGQTVANEVVVKVGANGLVDFANLSTGSTDVVVDLMGYFVTGAGMAFLPVEPTRFLDTRDGTGLAPGTTGKLAGGGTVDLQIANSHQIPGWADAVAANVTVTNPATNGYVTVYPDDGQSRPFTSMLNFGPGQTIPNAVTVGIGFPVNNGMKLFNGSSGPTDLVVDVFGYYSRWDQP